MSTKGARHPNTILKPNPDPNAHPNPKPSPNQKSVENGSKMCFSKDTFGLLRVHKQVE